MNFRCWRRIKIVPGVTLNLSKSGASLSLGPRGAHYTIGHGAVALLYCAQARTQARTQDRAQALRALGLHTAVRDLCTKALGRARRLAPELIRGYRYQRALCYEALGHGGRLRTELERIFASAPDYEDVAARLGLEEGVPDAQHA